MDNEILEKLIVENNLVTPKWLKGLRKLKKCRECPLVTEKCKLCGFKEAEDGDSN